VEVDQHGGVQMPTHDARTRGNRDRPTPTAVVRPVPSLPGAVALTVTVRATVVCAEIPDGLPSSPPLLSGKCTAARRGQPWFGDQPDTESSGASQDLLPVDALSQARPMWVSGQRVQSRVGEGILVGCLRSLVPGRVGRGNDGQLWVEPEGERVGSGRGSRGEPARQPQQVRVR
jgi:hypothetical protein